MGTEPGSERLPKLRVPSTPKSKASAGSDQYATTRSFALNGLAGGSERA
jgi:hypothetical protein